MNENVLKKGSLRFLSYAYLMRWHRPIGAWLLLWPTLWALWVASRVIGERWPTPRILVIFILGVWVMRSTGCVINDLIDQPFDGSVVRTCTRPLVTGAITRIEAWSLLGLLSLLALSLSVQLNKLSIQLSMIGLLLAFLYPFMKRLSYWPQLILGVAFGWPIPLSFAALTGNIPFIAWPLFGAAVLWPLGYDTLYAMQDCVDDRKLGLKSTALLWGNKVSWFVGSVYAGVLGLLVYIGLKLSYSVIYYLTLPLAAGLMGYQLYLISACGRQRYYEAFMNNHLVGAVLFLGFLLG